MKSVIWVFILVSIGCTSVKDEPEIKVTESIPTTQSVSVKTKMDSMMDIISYVDSAQVVEKQVESIIKLKEKNEELEIMVERSSKSG